MNTKAYKRRTPEKTYKSENLINLKCEMFDEIKNKANLARDVDLEKVWVYKRICG